MTVSNEDELAKLREIGAIVARTLEAMGRALEPGITTAELDGIGRALLEQAGARSAPELCYRFPGATCISVNEQVAHGIPGPRRIQAGDLVNIDVSAEKDGFFADTGASFAVPPVTPRAKALCRDGRRALWEGIRAVRPGAPLSGIGARIERFAGRSGYTLVRNLASHGVGRSLHEAPKEIATWFDPRDTRTIHEGLVFTIEPFLSTGADWVELGDDGWSLFADAGALTVQYEHSLVATRHGPVILTALQ
ncbi:MAG: type I methionyl aminopeptidase [Alphaproteobacteria bacterium]